LLICCSEADVAQLKPLAQELLVLKPDVMVGPEPSAATALRTVAPTLPIICFALTDAQIPDLIASYARPGGTVTGMAQSVEGITGKLLEVALEIVPGAVRIGFLSNPAGASMRLFAQSVDTAARAHGIAVLTEEATTNGGLAPAFDRFGTRGVQAVSSRSGSKPSSLGVHRASTVDTPLRTGIRPAGPAYRPLGCVGFRCGQSGDGVRACAPHRRRTMPSRATSGRPR
jgi:hypothetical protein